jgi:hypothetical protein
MTKLSRRLVTFGLGAASLCAVRPAHAQSYPVPTLRAYII